MSAIFDFFNSADILWWILITILFVLSYVGLILPAIPDVPMMVGGFLIYHFLIDSTDLAWWFWVTVILLTITMLVMDYVSGGIAAKKFGGSKLSMIIAPIGAVLFLWAPFGIVLGPLVSVFIIELFHRKGIQNSFKIAMSTVIGFLGSLVIKIIALTGTKIWFFYLIA